MRGKIEKQLSAWLPVILWAGLIFHFSSGTVPITSTVYWQNFAIKKTGHVLLFGVLSILIYRALRMDKVDRKKAAISAVVLSTFYGTTDEFHQLFTQGREARVRDIFIDGGGATLVILAAYYLPPKLSKKIYALVAKFDLT
jgi:VanZ family protein